MSELNEKCLDTFSTWLEALGEDVEAVLAVVEAEGLAGGAKRQLVAGINYLFKSLDLIPDGIDDIGYLDDAFVLRVAASLLDQDALEPAGADQAAAIRAMSDQTALIKEFLGDDTYQRLSHYTKDLRRGSARGRSVEEIIEDVDVFREFASEVHAFAKGYESPSFAREEKTLIKLRAFFDAKLPR